MANLTGEQWGPAYVAQYLRKYEGKHTPVVSRAQALAAVRLAGTPSGGDVIDCPCGNGRHSLPLAEAGFRVTGVDASQSMLDAARRAGARWPAPRWVAADYRRLPFADASFDTVLTLFTSIGFYGDEQDSRMLSEARRVLRPGGRLLIDTTHRDRLVRSLDMVAGSVPPAAPPPHDADADELTAFDPRTGWLETSYRDGAGGGHTVFRIRVYSTTELTQMLTAAGFRDIRVFGGLGGSPLTLDSRLVVTAAR